MRRTRRNWLTAGAAVGGLVLALSSVAWACTQMVGTVWLCPTTTSCVTANPPQPQAYPAGSTVYHYARALEKVNDKYDARYAAGLIDQAQCHTSSLMWGTFTTNQYGHWSKIPVKMPSQVGNYTQCATWPAGSSNPTHASEHKGFTVT